MMMGPSRKTLDGSGTGAAAGILAGKKLGPEKNDSLLVKEVPWGK